MRILFVLVCCCAGTSWAFEIDNHLVGEPVVDCQDTMVSLTFTTEKPFNGRVFIKGLSDDDRCSRNFATNTDQSKFSMLVNNGDCAMQRQRVQNDLMEGVMFSLVIVVSFHGTFITKVDRAFRCMCFFRNIKHFTNILDVSMIGTTELADTAKMPTCSYSIHADSPTGELIRYAKVGVKIFHVWECDDVNQGILVHTCWVTDGRNNKFDLLDVDGCAIDPIIQPDVKYDESLNKAYVETWSYKFSDTSILNYQCVIELCKKNQNECNGLTPPQCGRGRRKRNVDPKALMLLNATTEQQRPLAERVRDKESEIDVITTVDVLDTLDQDLGVSGPPNDLLRSLNHQPSRRSLLIADLNDGRLCLSTPSFGVVVAVTLVLFLAAIVSTSVLCYRLRYAKF